MGEEAALWDNAVGNNGAYASGYTAAEFIFWRSISHFAIKRNVCCGPRDARRHTRRSDAEENLRTNLRDMAEASRELGTPILLCTVSSNERGFAPSYAEPSIDRDSLKTWKKLVAEGIVAYEDNQYDAARSLFERALTLDKEQCLESFLPRALFGNVGKR